MICIAVFVFILPFLICLLLILHRLLRIRSQSRETTHTLGRQSFLYKV
jgi:hypothetical protein